VELADLSNHTRKNLERGNTRKMQDCYLLPNISHTNVYTHERALPHLMAVCAKDDPIGQ